MADFKTYLNDAKGYLAVSDYDRALDSFLLCLNFEQNKDVYVEIGKIYEQKNEYDKAVEYLIKALRNSVEDESVFFELAKIYFYKKDYRNSVVYCKKILDIKNDLNILEYTTDMIKKIYPVIRNDYADIKLIRELELYLDIDSSKYTEYPGNYPFDGDCDKLIKIYINVLKEEPENKQVLCFLAQTYNYIGEYDKTIELYKTNCGIFDGDVFFKNKFLNEYEVASGKTVLESKPRKLMVVLSTLCNLSCIMCVVRKTSWNIPEEKLEEIKQLFPYLEKIMWQGGEVLLLPYFKELLKTGLNYPNMKQSIVTNFQLADTETIELLVKNNIEITVSVDGVTKETYEKIRKKGNFEKLVHNLKVLNDIRKKIKNTVRLYMNVVVMRENYKDLGIFVDFAKQHGFDTVCFIPVQFKSHFDSDGIKFMKEQNIFFNFSENDRRILLEQSAIIEKKAKQLDIKLDNQIPGNLNEEFVRQEIFFDYNTDEVTRLKNNKWLSDDNNIKQDCKKSGKSVCHLPWYSMVLDYNGSVRPDCLCETNKNIGHLLSDKSLMEIWNNEEMQFYRRSLIDNKNKGLCNDFCLSDKINQYRLKLI